MKKRIVCAAVSAAGVAALAFGAAGSASAAGTITSSVCLQLPASVSGVAGQFAAAQAAANAAASDLGSKQVTLGRATNDLANTVVAYIRAADRGDNLTATGNALLAALSVFGDKAVSENNAMTASFDAQRTLYVAGLNTSFYGAINTGLCTVPATSTSTTIKPT